MPLLPVLISSVNNCLSKLGASLLFSTILLTIGSNCSIISKAPSLPLVSYISCTLLEACLPLSVWVNLTITSSITLVASAVLPSVIILPVIPFVAALVIPLPSPFTLPAFISLNLSTC